MSTKQPVVAVVLLSDPLGRLCVRRCGKAVHQAFHSVNLSKKCSKLEIFHSINLLNVCFFVGNQIVPNLIK